MNPELLYLIATLTTWIGWILIGKASFTAIRLVFASIPFGVDQVKRSALVSAGVGAALIILSFGLPKSLGRPGLDGLTIPIIWPYAPLSGWILMIGVAMALGSVVKLLNSLNDLERRSNWISLGSWGLIAGLGFWWLAASEEKIWVIRGQFPLHIPVLISVLILAIVTVFIMIAIEKNQSRRGLAKSFVKHFVLIAGCVVFGIPFAWLLVTSFKEERDIANTDGLVWVPQVQLTHPYFDPENPLVETQYQGRWVKAQLNSDLGDGKVLLEIERPYGVRGRRFETDRSSVKEIARTPFIWETDFKGQSVEAFTVYDQPSGDRELEILRPESLAGQRFVAKSDAMEPVRKPGVRWENYTEAMEWMPFETHFGLRYLTNTIWLVVMSVLGTVVSCSLVAYGFARLRFPGRDQLFTIMMATMMLPAAVTMMPQFLIFRSLGWIDTMMPLWVPTFFASAFNVFLLRQFFSTIPLELEEAARIDGASYLKTYWSVMMPQVKPALAVISIWTIMGAWNNFMGRLIYLTSPEKMPVSYALALFSGDRGLEPGLMMAFATMTVLPVLLLFFFAQRYFIEGVQLSGLGGR